MIKITIMAPRTTIQLGTWTPAIDVFRLNHSMTCHPRFKRRLTEDEAHRMAVNFARILPRRPRPKALVAARARPLWDRKRSSFACHSKVAGWNWR